MKNIMLTKMKFPKKMILRVTDFRDKNRKKWNLGQVKTHIWFIQKPNRGERIKRPKNTRKRAGNVSPFPSESVSD